MPKDRESRSTSVKFHTNAIVLVSEIDRFIGIDSDLIIDTLSTRYVL